MTAPRPWSTAAILAVWILTILLVGVLMWLAQTYLGGPRMISRDSITFFGAAPRAVNRGGRPKVPEPRVPVSSRLTPADYDRLAAAARARGLSVAAFVRAACRAALRPPR